MAKSEPLPDPKPYEVPTQLNVNFYNGTANRQKLTSEQTLQLSKDIRNLLGYLEHNPGAYVVVSPTTPAADGETLVKYPGPFVGKAVSKLLAARQKVGIDLLLKYARGSKVNPDQIIAGEYVYNSNQLSFVATIGYRFK